MPSTVLSSCVRVAAIASILLIAGCSGSSGGGSTPPTIVTAAFVGAGGNPAAGDTLVITVSKPSTLESGRVLDDTDFALSSGTLGTVSTAPTALSSTSFQITLGTGVTFQPGTTTIVFSDDQDALRSTDGQSAKGGTPRTITAGDGDAPTLSDFTLDNVDDALAGQGNAGGTLQVPITGFTIDLTHTDPTNPIDSSRTFIASNVNVSVNGANREAGQNLADALTLTSGTNSSSYLVPDTVRFQEGEQTLLAIVSDVTGMSSTSSTFRFRVRNMANEFRPFESGQTWFLDLSRDVESIDTSLNTSPVADATPDFNEILFAAGLQNATTIQNVQGAKDSNEVVVDLLKTRILAELTTLFSGANVSFTFDSSGSFPSGESSVPYADFSFSQICIAGSSGSNNNILGSALFDPSNTRQEDNCQTAFGVNDSRLGVFPHAAMRLGVLSGASSDFHVTFDPLAPAFSVTPGTPIGADTGDGARLVEVLNGTNTGNDNRITVMDTAIRKMARLVAVVTAHECGHSMGLVANGPMPQGLYGNDASNFPLSGNQPSTNADGHIQNTALFPDGAQNVMSPAINFEAAQSAFTVFNSLNLAYLRERAFYVPE